MSQLSSGSRCLLSLAACSSNIRIYIECEGGIEKPIPRFTNWNHEACRVITNGDHERRIFLSHPQMNNGFFFLLTTKYLILCWIKYEKDFHKILNTLRCAWSCNFNITLTSQIDMRQMCGCLVFYFFHGLVRVCEIELSRMGKNDGNPDLV